MQARRDLARRSLRIDQRPRHQHDEVALARPSEGGEADPAMVAAGDRLEKGGVKEGLGNPVELQRLGLGTDRAGDIDRGD
jgi:hypothetical protein